MKLLVRASLLLVISSVLIGCSSNDPPTERPYQLNSHYSIGSSEFRRTFGNLLGPPIVGGNSVKTLLNGEQIFPAMLDAIDSAQTTITFETYIYWKGKIGAAFTDAFCDRASHGVKVHVMLDKLGSMQIDPDYIKQMEAAGVIVNEFHAIKWFDLGWTNKFNNRTHRKLLIVDGTTGFIGGVGIADEWDGNAQDSKHYRDTHYLVKGPVVAQLQAAFVDNWMESTGHVLHGDDYFPQIKDAGETWSQVFKSSPHGGSESMELMYLMSIAAAQKSIRLATPYFVSDDITVNEILKARERGVAVRIIVPGVTIDEKVVRPASRARWGPLLKAGVEIMEYGPAMLHCKLMIVDDAWVSIGSANLDNRSFRLNDEANLNVLDSTFAAEQIRVFDEDAQHCKLITYDQWMNRPAGEKATESFLTMFGWLM